MPDHAQLKASLQDGLANLGLNPEAQQLEALITYLILLDKWNKAYNLSGIKDISQMLAYHLLDSLAILPIIVAMKETTFLDVGTGAGLPGIPLAICCPTKKFLLLDSNGKKTRFLFQVKTELGLDNIEIFHERIENFQSSEQIDIVLCRAFAALDRLAEQTSHILKDKGRLLAMKGQYPEAEIKAMPGSLEVRKVTEIQVPGVEGTRHLIDIGRSKQH